MTVPNNYYFFLKCSNAAKFLLTGTIFFLFSICSSFCKYLSDTIIWSSVFMVWNFAFVLVYIYFVYYFFCACLSVDIFFKVLRPITLFRLLFRGFCVFRTQFSKCCPKLLKRTYHWSLKVAFLVIKAKMVLR